MKKERHRFRPDGPDPLERRLALTHGGPVAPALIGTLSPNPQASGRSGRVVAQINAAFDQFANDYLQAQGAYLTSAAPQSTFVTFTTQRVNLLAQELTRIFARLPGSFHKIETASMRSATSNVVLQPFLRRNITGTGNDPDSGSQSLLKTLTSSAVVPPEMPAKPTGAAATLYTLAATNAIQTARTASINAARFIANGTFNKH
jgi:hypothetical protein